MAYRAIVLQQKTQRLVQFEIKEPTRETVGVACQLTALNFNFTL
jgi:hypothetical protein